MSDADIRAIAEAYTKGLQEFYRDMGNRTWRAQIMENCSEFRRQFDLRPTKHELTYFGPYYPSVFDHFETHVMHNNKDADGHLLYMFVCAPYIVATSVEKTLEEMRRAMKLGLIVHPKPLYHMGAVTLYRTGTTKALKAWLMDPDQSAT